MRLLKRLFIPAAFLILVGVILHDHLPPRPLAAASPRGGGAALGKAFAPILASTYADGWLAAAEALEEGDSVVEAQQRLQDTWKAGRVEAFSARVAPSFSAVLPAGTEPTDAVHRARVVKLWRDFARGLRETP